jgi:hypothetical protein
VYSSRWLIISTRPSNEISERGRRWVVYQCAQWSFVLGWLPRFKESTWIRNSLKVHVVIRKWNYNLSPLRWRILSEYCHLIGAYSVAVCQVSLPRHTVVNSNRQFLFHFVLLYSSVVINFVGLIFDLLEWELLNRVANPELPKFP